ncbi:histidine kinase [Planotetraspora thailandica]|uniref:histidine kinase n=1 Tax=Planotetraspora thailandica TaxID=487172 RepID=A0A8J3UYL2_9ACTN|nr:sensor domain-containing protein [Planotetraspora thailandica]GII53291.1 histidine kinase [Planotetraspora thailandica]
MRPQNAWQAVWRRDLPATSLPWRALAYLVTGALVGVVALVLLLAWLVTGALLTLVLVGIPLLAALALAGIPMGALERRRLRIIDPEPATTPFRPPGHGLRRWIRIRFSEQATWRSLGYTVLMATVLGPVELIAVTYGLVVPLVMICAPITVAQAGSVVLLKFWPLDTLPEAFTAGIAGVVILVLAAYPLTALATAHAMLARLMLTPRKGESGERLAELTRSRTRLVEAFEVERRRIERDLHDGAQQRLVALTMTLGLAKVSHGEEAAGLVARAHEEAKLALAEIRDLIRGIHPRILVDRGLPAALAELADRSPVPVETAVEIPRRLPEAVESVAYFVVSEALANVAKHSQAGQAWVTGRLDDRRLTVEIRDDGVGGADADAGTGLAGLADRVAAVDGKLMLSSPAGGPTLLRVEIPCPSTTH